MLFIRNKDDKSEATYIIDNGLENNIRKIACDVLSDHGYTTDEKKTMQRNLAYLDDTVEWWIGTKRLVWKLFITAIIGALITICGIGFKGYF